MANVTLRLVKGSPLTNSEVDNNFSNLNIFKTEIGGDLGGNVFYPTVIGLRGRSVSNTEPANSQVLSWSTASNAWIPTNSVSTVSYNELTTKPAVNVSITGDLTGSSNVVLANTNTNNLSINVSYDYDNLDSRFLKLHNPTTQYVTSYIEFQGNVIFAGNVTTISANNLIIEDNFIYLSSNNFVSNDDFGFVGNYNDGIYAHSGFFRDASDNGTWKIFEGYLPEPDTAVNIDTDNVSFRLANLAINTLTANAIQGIVSTNLVTNLNADLLDGQQGVYYTNYTNQSNKPAANIILTGDVSGTANALLTANSTILSITATIQPDSVALGTDTTGNYTDRVISGTGISVSGTSDEGNVITVGLTNTAVTPSTYGNATVVPIITVDAQGRITSASNVVIAATGGGGGGGTTNYSDLTNKPAANIILTGDVTGSANALLTASSTVLSITTTIQPNSVILGTDTTGNYVDRVEGANITVTGTVDEGNVITISIPQAISPSSDLQFRNVTLSGNLSLPAVANIIGSTTLTLVGTTQATSSSTGELVVQGGIGAGGNIWAAGNIIAANIFANITSSSFLPNSGVTANTYGNATIVPVITVDAKGRITSASNVAINIPASTTNYNALENKPAANIILSGAVTGSANVVLTSNTTVIAITTTIQPRSFNVASNTTITPDISLYDNYILTAQASNLTVNASTLGSPVNGQKIIFRIKDDGTVRFITWSNTAPGGFRQIGATLPANTSPAANIIYVGCIYNADDTFWDVVAVNNQGA